MTNRFLHPAADSLRRHRRGQLYDLPPGLIDLPLNAGETPLAHAASEGSLHQLAELLALGASVDVPDLRGIPPIVHAAIARRTDNVVLLLNHGADVDAADANGRTALHYAFFFGDVPTATVLLGQGGNMFRRDVDGRAVIDYARAIHGEKDVKEISGLAQNVIQELEEARVAEAAEHEVKRGRVPSLRGHPDFQRLDRIRQALNLGIEGVWSGSLYLIFGAGLIAGLVFQNPAVGLVGIYLAIVLRLVFVFLDKTMARSAPLRKSKPLGKSNPLENSNRTPAASVREVSFILRAASRHMLSRLDKGIGRPAKTLMAECLLWLLALVAPIASLAVVLLILGVVAGALKLVIYIPILGWIVAAAAGVTAVMLVPRLIVGLSEQIFSFGANPLLVRKITARQTALSAHINAGRTLREGGDFADGGVLYLRSFGFDGSFVSGGLDFELLLLRLFQGRAPLFALSADPKSRGALNLETTDSEWRTVLNDMLPRAGLILMIPAETSGVLEEMEILQRDGWLDKTLFIAPPENDSNTVGTAWDGMRLRTEFRHLEIPPYCDTGFLFRLDPNGKLLEAGPLGIDRMPTPLVAPEEPLEAKAGPDSEGSDADEGDISPDDGGRQDGGASADGGGAVGSSPVPGAASVNTTATVSSSASLATSSAQFASLSLAMQSVSILSAEQLLALSDAGGDGGDGDDADGFDGGGFDGGGAG